MPPVSITDSATNRTLSLGLGLHFNETVNILITVPDPCYGIFCDQNKIQPDRALVTYFDDPILVQFIGNKAAHLYNGNVSKSNRKPKYPCKTCNKAVTSRSKAVYLRKMDPRTVHTLSFSREIRYPSARKDSF